MENFTNQTHFSYHAIGISDLGFEKDIELLKVALTETEFRIKKLEEHKEIINKLLRDNKTEDSWINETRKRLVRNIRNLQKKRDRIFRELES